MNRPFHFDDAIVQRQFGHSEYARPILQAMGLSFVGDVAGGAGIPFLFRARRPATVLRRVMFIVINAFYGHAWRTWPHVGTELVKVFPRGAHGNAARSIVRKGLILGIRAALVHRLPNTIEWMLRFVSVQLYRLREGAFDRPVHVEETGLESTPLDPESSRPGADIGGFSLIGNQVRSTRGCAHFFTSNRADLHLGQIRTSFCRGIQV